MFRVVGLAARHYVRAVRSEAREWRPITETLIMLIRLLATLIVGLGLLATPASARPHHTTTSAAAAPSGQMQQFDSEAAAQAHCPSDVIVWLNTNSGIYHEKGMRWYGRTKHGAFVCRKEADADGDRDTRNGQ